MIVTSVAPMLVDKATSLLAHIFPARRAHVARVTDGCPGGAQKRPPPSPLPRAAGAAWTRTRPTSCCPVRWLSYSTSRSFSRLSFHALLKSALHDSHDNWLCMIPFTTGSAESVCFPLQLGHHASLATGSSCSWLGNLPAFLTVVCPKFVHASLQLALLLRCICH